MSGADENAITRCVCLDILFTEIAALHREQGLDFDAICDRTGCCTGCSMCEPYVRLTIATGRTRYPILDSREVREAMALDV